MAVVPYTVTIKCLSLFATAWQHYFHYQLRAFFDSWWVRFRVGQPCQVVNCTKSCCICCYRRESKWAMGSDTHLGFSVSKILKEFYWVIFFFYRNTRKSWVFFYTIDGVFFSRMTPSNFSKNRLPTPEVIYGHGILWNQSQKPTGLLHRP